MWEVKWSSIELFFQFTQSAVHTLTHGKTYTHTTGCKTGRVQSKSSAPTVSQSPMIVKDRSTQKDSTKGSTGQWMKSVVVAAVPCIVAATIHWECSLIVLWLRGLSCFGYVCFHAQLAALSCCVCVDKSLAHGSLMVCVIQFYYSIYAPQCYLVFIINILFHWAKVFLKQTKGVKKVNIFI